MPRTSVPLLFLGEFILDVIQPPTEPPDGLNEDSLAPTLLYHMGVGRMQPNMLAAAEALRVKAYEPGFNLKKAYIFICGRWAQYKQSAHYRSQFRRSVANWLSEGDYNNPQSWGDPPDPVLGSDYVKPKEWGPKEWSRDKQLHPEKYLSEAEVKSLFADLNRLLEGKRMPRC